MLDDHLDEGKFGQAHHLDCKIWYHTKSLANTIAESKQDFGMLDRLVKLKPKALDLAYEGNIHCTRNKKNEWRKKTMPVELDKTLDFTEKSKSRSQALYFHTKKLIFENKNEKLKQNMLQNEKKEKRDVEERERSLKQLNDFGRLWDLEVLDTESSANVQ